MILLSRSGCTEGDEATRRESHTKCDATPGGSLRPRGVPRERRPSEPAALRLLFDAIRTAGRAAAIELDPLYERWQRTGAVLVCTVEVEQGDDVAVVAIDDVELTGAEFLHLLAAHRASVAVVFLDE